MEFNKAIKIFEILRWVGVFIGIFLAFYYGQTPEQQFNIMFVWITVSLAGLTGINLFFGKTSSEYSGYMSESGFKRQSGINLLALAITALIVYFLNWGILAESAVMIILLIFLVFNSINHVYSAVLEGAKNKINILRPVMTLILLIVVLPVMLNAISSVK
jgi:hypothetical protein